MLLSVHPSPTSQPRGASGIFAGELALVERTAVPACGLLPREVLERVDRGALRGIGGHLGITEGPGRDQVARQLCGVAAGLGDERVGGAPVQASAATRGQLLVERLADQPVREPVAIHTRLHEQAALRRLLEHVEQGHGSAIGELGQPAEIELQPEYRRGAQHVVGAVVEHREAPTDHVTYAFGHARFRDRPGGDPMPAVIDDGAGLGEVQEHLLKEERVALGLVPEQRAELAALVLERVTAGGLHEAQDLALVEPAERHAVDAGDAAQVGEGRGERVAAGHIGVAVGADHREAHRCGRTRNPHEQLDTRRVGPMEVIEHEQCRRLLRGAHEQVDDALEQAHARQLGVARRCFGQRTAKPPTQLGYQAVEIAAGVRHVCFEHLDRRVRDEMAQRLHPRRVGRADLLEAAAEQHDRTVGVHGARDLAHETRLADARFPGEQHDAAALDARFLPAGLEQLARGSTARVGKAAGLGERPGQRHRDLGFAVVGS